jgi:hypothetical protein
VDIRIDGTGIYVLASPPSPGILWRCAFGACTAANLTDLRSPYLYSPAALGLNSNSIYVASNAPAVVAEVQVYDKFDGGSKGAIVTSAGALPDGGQTHIIALASDDGRVIWGTDEPNHPLYSCAAATCLDGGAIAQGSPTLPIAASPAGSALRNLTTVGSGTTNGIFWGEAPSLSLATAAEDLSTSQTFWSGAVFPVSSVAHDSAGRFYWIEGSMIRTCIANGLSPCATGNLSTVATTTGGGPLTEVTVAGGYVFWFDLGARALMRANALP